MLKKLKMMEIRQWWKTPVIFKSGTVRIGHFNEELYKKYLMERQVIR